MTSRKTTEKKLLSMVIRSPCRASVGRSNSRLGRVNSRGGGRGLRSLAMIMMSHWPEIVTNGTVLGQHRKLVKLRQMVSKHTLLCVQHLLVF